MHPRICFASVLIYYRFGNNLVFYTRYNRYNYYILPGDVVFITFVVFSPGLGKCVALLDFFPLIFLVFIFIFIFISFVFYFYLPRYVVFPPAVLLRTGKKNPIFYISVVLALISHKIIFSFIICFYRLRNYFSAFIFAAFLFFNHFFAPRFCLFFVLFFSL